MGEAPGAGAGAGGGAEGAEPAVSRRESFAADLAADEAHLRLMATSDLHMALAPWDYSTDAPGGPPGLAGVAALAGRLRAASGASLLFDCGDFLQGSAMADHVGLERGLAPGETHPMIAAMNAAGYDAVTLGNHEFDYGLPFLETALARARFPVVTSNLVRRLGPSPLRDTPFRRPRLLRELSLPLAGGGTAPLRLGVIGLCPPHVLAWVGARLDGDLATRGMLEAAAAHAAALRREGADLVVALVHAGIGADGPGAADEPGGPDTATALSLALATDLDALMLGHSHQVFPAATLEVAAADSPARGGGAVDARSGRLGGRPAVMPGVRGSHLGVIDLVLARDRQGGWRPRRAEARALAVPPPPGDCTIRRATRRLHAATRAHMARSIGQSRLRLHSHFALIAESPALRLMAEAQRHWAREAMRGRPGADLPIVSAVTPFRAGGASGPGHFTDIPPGPLCLRHLHDLCEFANMLRILCLSGVEVAAWLERSAATYARLGPDRPDTPLLAPGAAPYACDILDGVGYALDLGRPALHAPDGRPLAPAADAPRDPRAPPPQGPGDRSRDGRLRELTLDGRPMAPEARVLLVTNDFRVAGGGRYPGALARRVVLESRETTRDALRRHIEARGAIAPPPAAAGWRLIAPRGSTALFDTAPAAAGHLDGIAAFAPEPLGLTRDGFLRLRLHFG